MKEKRPDWEIPREMLEANFSVAIRWQHNREKSLRGAKIFHDRCSCIELDNMLTITLTEAKRYNIRPCKHCLAEAWEKHG